MAPHVSNLEGMAGEMNSPDAIACKGFLRPIRVASSGVSFTDPAHRLWERIMSFERIRASRLHQIFRSCLHEPYPFT